MKKLFALLLVLVMVIALVPTAVAAAEADGAPAAPAAEGNSENSENPVNPGNPENPETPKNPETPENSHEGHMATWKIDTTTHVWYCFFCGGPVGDPEPHSFNPATHRCTVCGMPDSSYCDHKDTAYLSLGSEGHFKYCTFCSVELTKVESHSFDPVSHKCTVCGESEPNPECAHKNIAYSPAGSEGHVKYCSDCFADLSDIEPHHRVGNVCDLCGFDKFDCSHEHTVWSYNDNYHHLLCKDCNTIIDDGEHVGMNDDICDKCGFKTNAEHHFLPGSHDCTDPGCNYRSFCSDPNGDGKCDTCGAPGHFGDVIWKDLDDNSHEAICSECKESMWTASHYDDDNDGKCDACGHKMSGTTGGGTTGGKENTGLDKVPKTGDVMAPVAVLSGLMSVAAVFTRKRFF